MFASQRVNLLHLHVRNTCKLAMIWRSASRYAASSGERISASDTISISGFLGGLRIHKIRSPVRILPASSSRWTRSIRDTFVCPSTSISIQPSWPIGYQSRDLNYRFWIIRGKIVLRSNFARNGTVQRKRYAFEFLTRVYSRQEVPWISPVIDVYILIFGSLKMRWWWKNIFESFLILNQ